MGNLMIEIVLRKEGNTHLPKFMGLIGRNIVMESDDKIILDFPNDWVGFKDGTVIELFKLCGEFMYVALAYFATGSEIVTDIDGAPIDSYDVVVDNKKICKYVKKKLRIVNIINQSENKFEVLAYMLDVRMYPPVVKILDVYSGDVESGIKLDMFVD